MKSPLSRHKTNTRLSKSRKPWEPPTIVVERSLFLRTEQFYIRRRPIANQDAKASRKSHGWDAHGVKTLGYRIAPFGLKERDYLG